MTHIFQNDSMRQQYKWLSFSKKTIKVGKTCGYVEKNPHGELWVV
jgi:hypothetical protein